MPSSCLIVALTLVCAAFTLAFLGDRPISRAQEARVLETSRQMLAAGDWRGWMVPRLNDEARLPPLGDRYTGRTSSRLLPASMRFDRVIR